MLFHRRLISTLKIALISATSLVISACGGGGGSSSTAGLGRYDYPSALDTSFGDAGYRVFSTGLPARAYLGAFNPVHMTTDSYGRIVNMPSPTATEITSALNDFDVASDGSIVATVPEEVGQRSHEGRFVKQLISFTPMNVVAKNLLTSPKTLVALGAGDGTTVWNIVSVERTGTNEDLVTLRARTNMGFLPDLLLESVPEAARLRVSESINKVVDGAHRGSGITVVDLCRDALVVMLATHLHLELGAASNINEKDLGPLIVALPEDRKAVKTAAEVVRSLHSRGKSNEQYRLGTRTVSDMDGTLAIEALGFVMRELSWTR